jgi:TorA maturation chaperone TorD
VTDAPSERPSALESEAIALDLLRRLFLSGPDPALIESIGALEPGALRLASEARRAAADLVGLASANRARMAEWVEALQVEYARLFIGPLDPPVLLYASCHLSPSPAVIGEETLAVRKAYAGSGLVVERLNSIPDDHLGVELEFLFALTRAAADAADPATAARHLETREAFHRQHVATWAGRVADGILAASPDPFFRAAATLLRNCPSS